MKREFVVLVVLAAGCGTQNSTESATALTASAAMSLTISNATLAQTSDAMWSLTKTGKVDPVLRTITRSINAAQGPTVVNHLVVDGSMALTNAGTAGATIGNVVVTWVTRIALLREQS